MAQANREETLQYKKHPLLKSDVSTKDAFDYYSLFYKRGDRYPYKTYSKIINGFLKYLAEQLINIGIVKLPSSLGVLQILGTSIRTKIDENGKMYSAVNWGETRKLWEEYPDLKEKKQLIFYTNEHSDYNAYRIFWITKTNKIYNKTRYKFQASWTLKRNLAKKIMSGDYAYLKHSIVKTIKK